MKNEKVKEKTLNNIKIAHRNATEVFYGIDTQALSLIDQREVKNIGPVVDLPKPKL